MDLKKILDDYTRIEDKRNKDRYFNDNIDSIIVSISNYYFVKYKIKDCYKSDIQSSVYLKFFKFMEKYKSIEINNHLAYLYIVIGNKIYDEKIKLDKDKNMINIDDINI